MSNTLKTSKSLVLTAALLALLSSAAPGMAAGPAPVDLGSAGNFVILSKAGITDVPASVIVGDIGTSPITGASMTGLTCDQVNGTIYTVDDTVTGISTGPAPCSLIDPVLLGAAVLDMGTAYLDAESRAPTSPTIGAAGEIGGLTIYPGVYQWGSAVTINSDVTLSGGPNDVWIFQIAQTLNIASDGSVPDGIKVILAGGARAANVFWQVAGATTLGTYSTFNGTILDQTKIALQTGAVLNGRALAQTEVTLDQNAITITAETKTQCQGFLKAEKTVFDNGQKAAKNTFDAAQKVAKQVWQIANPHPTSAAKKAFDAGQKADKNTFDAAQKTDKLVFAAQQIIDKAQCNTLQ
jgi:Ice-binding-like